VNVRVLEVARQELDEAVSYYNGQVAGLGDAFLLEAVAAIERIRQFPDAWHPLGERVRRCRLRRFPYGLIYHLSRRRNRDPVGCGGAYAPAAGVLARQAERAID